MTSDPQDESLGEQTSSSSCSFDTIGGSKGSSFVFNINDDSNINITNNIRNDQFQFEGFKDFEFQYPSSLSMRKTYGVIEKFIAKQVTSMQLHKLARNLIKEDLIAHRLGANAGEFVSLSKPSSLCAIEMCSGSYFDGRSSFFDRLQSECGIYAQRSCSHAFKL